MEEKKAVWTDPATITLKALHSQGIKPKAISDYLQKHNLGTYSARQCSTKIGNLSAKHGDGKLSPLVDVALETDSEEDSEEDIEVNPSSTAGILHSL